MPSIHDVAKKAGVSTATVSRTFRSPDLIAEETHGRVMEAARQLKYSPRGSRTVKTKTKDPAVTHEAIGFQFFADRPGDAPASNAFYAPMLMGVQEEAAALGLNLLVHATDRHRLSRDLPKMVQDRSIAGMLLVGAAGDAEVLSLFAACVPHIVLLDNRDRTERFESVTSDSFNGTYAATQYLLTLGHRRIAFFLPESGVESFQDRLHGYISALFDVGITPAPSLVIRGEYDDSDEMRETRLAELFGKADRPTALLTANDEYAFFALRSLRRLGLRVPEDVSLIGFDDVSFSTHTDPPLTTVRVDKEAMGRFAVRRLLARMQGTADTRTPIQHRLPVTLVRRQSVSGLSSVG